MDTRQDAQQNMQHNIFYRHFDLPAHFPVIGLLGDSWQYVREPVSRMHFHNCLEIGYLYKGSGQYYVDDKEVHFEAPAIVLAPPNAPHANIVDEGTVCGWKWIYVDPIQLLPQLSPRLANAINQYQRLLAGADCILSAKEHPQIFALTEMIIGEMEGQGQHYHHIVRELLYAFFLLLLRVSPTVQPSDHFINPRMGCIAPAISFIAENYMNDLSIEELAQLCHVSTSHFRRLFKQVLGWAPLDYLQVIRIDRACVLLYNCEYSVTDIGMQVGYPSPSSFSRQFRRIHGISPSQWRQKMRSEENPIVTAYFNSVPHATQQFFPLEQG